MNPVMDNVVALRPEFAQALRPQLVGESADYDWSAPAFVLGEDARLAAAIAEVVDDLTSETPPSGEERLCDGRRKGAHGNRVSPAMKASVCQVLLTHLDPHGEVSLQVRRAEAERAGVDVRTINRWARALQLRAVDAAVEITDGQAETPGARAQRAAAEYQLPVALRRVRDRRDGQRARLELNLDEVAFLLSHKPLRKAIRALIGNPAHRLYGYSESHLYAALAEVAPSVREAARKASAAAGRKIEMTMPLSGRDQLNESWSIDEYDLKLVAVDDDTGELVQPKLLCVRERASGVPVAVRVLTAAATTEDTIRVLGAAVVGWARDGIRVHGSPRYLVTDQGGALVGQEAVTAMATLGFAPMPIASHQPQANGDHEVMHQSLLAKFADGPGSRRGWTDRAGNVAHHGALLLSEVWDLVAEWHAEYLDEPYTATDHRHGRTRWQAYADLAAAGDRYEFMPDEEDIARVAPLLCERTVDPTRGVMVDTDYWTGPGLANAGRLGLRVSVRQLLDPDLMYAFDARTGDYLGELRRRDQTPEHDQADLYADRAQREAFSKHVAHRRTTRARAEADELNRNRGDNPDLPDAVLEAEVNNPHAGEQQSEAGPDEPRDEREMTQEAPAAEPSAPTRSGPPPPLPPNRRPGLKKEAAAGEDAYSGLTDRFRRTRPQPDEEGGDDAP